MLEQGRGGRSHPILTKWQVKPHTFDLVLPLHQKCVERLESHCRSQRCRCGSFWFQLHTFQLLHQSVHKGWNLIAEATGVVAVLSGPFGVGGQAGILPIAQAISQQVHAAINDMRWSCK